MIDLIQSVAIVILGLAVTQLARAVATTREGRQGRAPKRFTPSVSTPSTPPPPKKGD